MLLVFFDSEGIVHHEYAPACQTMNKDFYLQVFRRLRESVRRKRPEKWRDSTGSCTMTMRPHTLHTLCSGFWPNRAPLSCSSRHTYQISHRVTFSYYQGLSKFWRTPIWGNGGHQTKFDEDIPKEVFAKCFQQWQQCWAKCLAAEGKYVEEN